MYCIMLYRDVIGNDLNLHSELEYRWYMLFACLQYYALLTLPIKKNPDCCFSSNVSGELSLCCVRDDSAKVKDRPFL